MKGEPSPTVSDSEGGVAPGSNMVTYGYAPETGLWGMQGDPGRALLGAEAAHIAAAQQHGAGVYYAGMPQGMGIGPGGMKQLHSNLIEGSSTSPDFVTVYRLLGGLFDPDVRADPREQSHVEKLKTMSPIDRETALLLMRNLASNLMCPRMWEEQIQLIGAGCPTFVHAQNAQDMLPARHGNGNNGNGNGDQSHQSSGNGDSNGGGSSQSSGKGGNQERTDGAGFSGANSFAHPSNSMLSMQVGGTSGGNGNNTEIPDPQQMVLWGDQTASYLQEDGGKAFAHDSDMAMAPLSEHLDHGGSEHQTGVLIT